MNFSAANQKHFFFVTALIIVVGSEHEKNVNLSQIKVKLYINHYVYLLSLRQHFEVSVVVASESER